MELADVIAADLEMMVALPQIGNVAIEYYVRGGSVASTVSGHWLPGRMLNITMMPHGKDNAIYGVMMIPASAIAVVREGDRLVFLGKEWKVQNSELDALNRHSLQLRRIEPQERSRQDSRASGVGP